MSEHSIDTWVWCGHCSAAAWGVPPHGEGEPCPLTMRRAEQEMFIRKEEHESRLEATRIANEKMEAERAYWEHALEGGSLMDIFKRSLR